MLNLHKLDVFLKVIEAGSFSRAGETLLMTQSAISHHMRDLEAQLGTALFNRGPRGVTLTDSGELLRDYVMQIMTLVAEAESAVTNVANLEDGEIKVGATPGVSVYLLPDCIVLFREKLRKLSVAMQTGTSAEVIELLQAGKIEIGIIEGEIEESVNSSLQVELLHEIQQKVIIGPNHPWWGRETISFGELNHQEFVMRQPGSQTRIWLDAILAQQEIQPHINTVFDNIDSIKRSVMRGKCLAIMPEYTIQDELKQGAIQALSIKEESLTRTLKILQLIGKPISPAANRFLGHLEECLHTK